MRRVAYVLFGLAVGCSHTRSRPVEKNADAALDAVYVVPDGPPPSVDAAPPPMPACMADAGTCQLPPSTCLDDWYLVYYTGGDCVDGTCRFTTNLLYCPSTCMNGGCSGGFT
jgi:hypothetical protein